MRDSGAQGKPAPSGLELSYFERANRIGNVEVSVGPRPERAGVYYLAPGYLVYARGFVNVPGKAYERVILFYESSHRRAAHMGPARNRVVDRAYRGLV